MSRSVEYVLDTNDMTAALVWEYRDGKCTHYMGNTQLMMRDNNNDVIAGKIIDWLGSHVVAGPAEANGL